MNRADFYDTELQRYDAHFRAALDISPQDRVLDIGCGAGQTTRDAARVAAEGSALGVDVSEELLDVARRRSVEEGLRNVEFELGDAQTLPFPAAHFHLCISRFGVMFFADPVAAFTNIRRAMRPGGRLVLMVWQSRERNEWSTAIQDALAPADAPSANAGAAFSLADRATTTRILVAAGFSSIDFAEVNEPVFYGPNADISQEAAAELFMTKDRFGDKEEVDAARQRLRALLDAHVTSDGVLFSFCAWIVTAKLIALQYPR